MPFLDKALLKFICAILVLSGGVSICGLPVSAPPSATPTSTSSQTSTSTITPTYTLTPTRTVTSSPSATATRTSTPTLTPTLAPLAGFSSRVLREGVQPESYIDDQCFYLKMRWSGEGSAPGTVVVPIMFHSIAQDGTQLADPNKDITGEQFLYFVDYARYLGFETITTQQLLDFLTQNAPIPRRSMMLIVDDRRPGMINEWLMPILEQYQWTATPAYIADPNSMQWAWDLMDQLNATGKLDVQSHGYTGQLYILPETPLQEIQNEIWNSTPVLEQHFGKRPIAFIWPGGNFTPLSAEVAREGGYELGFSAYSRGPLLFNWIPLGAEERAVTDPLMVLPRAWSSAANINLDEAVKISEQATAFAEEYFSTEADWFATYCGGELTRP